MPADRFLHTPLQLDRLPEPIFHQVRQMPANTVYLPHQHQWGEFVFSFSGVLEMKAEGLEFRVPPNFGLWHPPGCEHHGGNTHASLHCSLYIDAALAHERGMPDRTCALLINPMLQAILNHLRHHPPQSPYTVQESKLLDVVLDQLVASPATGSYLPNSSDGTLIKVLNYLKDDPANSQPLSAIAEYFGTTERTLARKARRDLGMPLSEWRQRLKVMRSIVLLQEGMSVESVALDLGYSTASAFIAMFRRLLNTTPDEYRKQQSTL
ncbi:AraC family transcriptional regulator [Neptunomonas marina]|uniref:AraC family transcriptional regulator n=1 Tax=Neptunomonas marina TaxID=1815562 RepID=A0A437QDD7_9GAMM|nr:helix-turn-helix transcriptional regulator [Neptunomonas marina]RVU32550.1 AraC family transcriptional regulator [Neptunomonas marina]